MSTHSMLLSRSQSVNECSSRNSANQLDSTKPKGSVCGDLQRNSTSSSSSSHSDKTSKKDPSTFRDKKVKNGISLRSRSVATSVLWHGSQMGKRTNPRKKLFYPTRRRSKESHKYQTLSEHNRLQAQVLTSGSQEFISLSQKYQPKSFQEIAGHKIIVKALSTAVEKKKIAPLYLFHGPNGTGKTSTARIFSMALNCESASLQNKPCCNCKGCSRSLYVMELCSGTGFEKIKTLLQNTSFTRAIPGLKVLIVEECHSFTSESWDELLSIVEGPYGSTLIFVLITLDANKVMGNISSRCQKFYFPKLNDEDITLKLTRILVREDVQIEREALKLIVSKSEGSLRDAENILDQLALLGPTINTSMVQQLVGLIPQHKLIDFLITAFSGDTTKTLRYAKELITGVEPLALISQLTTLIIDILSGTFVIATSSSSSTSTELLEDKGLLRIRSQIAKTHSAKLSNALKILVETEKQFRSSTDQTSGLLSALLDITSEDASRRISTGIVLPGHIAVSSGQITEPNILFEGIDKSHEYIGKAVPEKTNLANMSDMEKIWKDVLERIESRRTKEFLWQQVKLESISISRTNAIVHLIFRRPEEKMAAQTSEKTLAKALEIAIGCPVTVNMSLDPFGSKLVEEKAILSESHILSSQQQKFGQRNNNKGQTSLITARESSQLSESLRIPKTKVKSTSQGQEISTPSKGKGKSTVKHRWLSLSSIPAIDSSVEPYSQDVLYENANKERENKVRKKLMAHKRFSKAIEDYHSHSTATQLQLKTSWSCIDICCSRNTQV